MSVKDFRPSILSFEMEATNNGIRVVVSIGGLRQLRMPITNDKIDSTLICLLVDNVGGKGSEIIQNITYDFDEMELDNNYMKFLFDFDINMSELGDYIYRFYTIELHWLVFGNETFDESTNILQVKIPYLEVSTDEKGD
ncbi:MULTISPECIES: hypothetical protein [Listeria]|uniref:Uncharacterized protein n=1 Tax=Listeria immobilis TaxID=2713502 RepID=A0ABR6SYR6_9LIST|nr:MULTISPECIES: hypothetical protein [Listeria]EAC2891950.1 hypothetical protein [Listeria monocytogenes]EAF4132487.1 hypothetical protein [Listeria monocytogenes]EAF4935401.1 hypothetical protein [Listeria monocytogenes]ECR2392728.1 hypothetical protein [Listeria monocytogenes]ECR2512794.1 hypothetical protein [Listeria monocytogenes]